MAERDVALTILEDPTKRTAGTRMGRRRAIVLVAVHLLFVAHLIHYFVTGSTLSPLEPSEATYTLRDGVINAGAVFLCLLILSTLILGRWFCGWACHLVAYQDAARWLLIKIGLRPKPFRARILMLIPFFAAYWLFGKPLVERWFLDAQPRNAAFVVEFTTESFWATFPGATIAILTILTCGGLMVWLLGSKGFCTYGCPYGALFVVSDKVAKGRIRVNEDCDHTGNCTRNCSSNVNVAYEVATYGMVVDPGCMKCLDCVTGCPNDALSFGFSSTVKPAATTKKKRRRSWDLSWPEEIAAGLLFVGAFLAWFDLYGLIPLLFAVGLSAMSAAFLIMSSRLLTQRDVVLQRMRLKSDGRMHRAGACALLASVLGVVFLGHSILVNNLDRRVTESYDTAARARVNMAGDPQQQSSYDTALAEFDGAIERAMDWGLITTRGHHRMLGERLRWDGRYDDAIAAFDKEIAMAGRHRDVELSKALALIGSGDVEGGSVLIDGALDQSQPMALRYERLAWELDRMARATSSREFGMSVLHLTREILREGLEHHPTNDTLAFQLIVGLMSWPDASLRNPPEAVALAHFMVEAGTMEHPDLLALCGRVYADEGDLSMAAELTSQGAALAREQGNASVADQLEATADEYRRRLSADG